MEPESAFKELYPWVGAFRRRLSDVKAPPLSGDTLYITSDSSGSDHRSRYNVYSFLAVCPSDLMEWQEHRSHVRSSFLADGRRLSFKGLNDRRQVAALPHFLEAARLIPGQCVTIAISKRIRSLGHGDMFLKENAPIALKHGWSGRALETMVRMTHFMALLIQHLGKPGQNVYWVSDEDDIFAGHARRNDLISA